MKSNKFWIILLGVMLIVSVAAALLLWQAPAGRALIYKNGELLTDKVNLLAVTEPFAIVVDGGANAGDGGFNEIEVEHGRVRISKSDCALNICVHRGWVSGGVIPLVCLPNRLVITFESDPADRAVDAVVG